MAAKMHTNNHRGKLWLIFGGALALIGIVTLLTTILILRPANNTPNAFLRARQAVSFPIFYPKDPPVSMTFKESSMSYTKDVVLYTYTYDGNKLLSISIQPKGGGFDVADFRPTSEFTTHIGRAYLVDLEDRTSAAVVGDKSWALINAPDGIAETMLRDFIDSLRPVE